MKKYWTMITRDYLNHWTVCNGVREYVSNMLDSPAASEYEIGEDFVILTSKDITLPATIFTMGYSQNRKDDEAVGQFGEVLEGHIGQVIKGIQGKLFVGGIFVCDIPKHVYSYNFKSKYLPLNRDRQSVNDWDLGVQTQRLLDEVESAQGIAKLIIDKSPDVYYSKFGVDLPVAEAVFNDFVEVHGTKVVASDWMEAGRLTDEGYEDVFVTGNEAMTKAIQKSTGYKEFLQTVDKVVEEVDTTTPLQLLEDWFSSSFTVIEHGQSDFEKILDLFRDKGVEFSN